MATYANPDVLSLTAKGAFGGAVGRRFEDEEEEEEGEEGDTGRRGQPVELRGQAADIPRRSRAQLMRPGLARAPYPQQPSSGRTARARRCVPATGAGWGRGRRAL